MFSYTGREKEMCRKPPPNDENIGYWVNNRTIQVTGEAHTENFTCVSNPVAASTTGWLHLPHQYSQPAQRQPNSSKIALQEEPFQR